MSLQPVQPGHKSGGRKFSLDSDPRHQEHNGKGFFAGLMSLMGRKVGGGSGGNGSGGGGSGAGGSSGRWQKTSSTEITELISSASTSTRPNEVSR